MKTQRYVITALLFICSSITCSTLNAATIQPKLKKIYVDEAAVKVTKGGITIQTNKGLIRAKTLRSDKHGIFVFEQELSLTQKTPCSCHYCFRLFRSEAQRDSHEERCELNPANS